MADTWHVISNGQRQVTTLSPNGTGFQEVIEVTYMIDKGPAAGNSFTVRIPASQYTPDYVRSVIDTASAQHNEIAGL